MKYSILVLIAGTAFAAPLFVMFPQDAAYTDAAIVPVTTRYLSRADFVGYAAAHTVPALGQLVPPEHLTVLSPSLRAVQVYAVVSCSEAPGVIVFAPAVNPPVGSLASAIDAIKATGCRQAGFMPASTYFGVTHCGVNLESSPYQKEDWSKLDYLIIPGGGLLDDQCIGKTGVADYVNLAKTLAAYARERNPKVSVVAHLSFRNASPEVMVQAAKALTGIVDGFLLAYPVFSEHRYCTAPNLQMFLSAIRQ
jgi:hypothetical protein